jgi:tRNA(fMet)-specific endonuclease VapC
VTLLLLDTTFLIDTERTGGRLDELILDDDDVAIAAITVAELLVGVELVATAPHRAERARFVMTIVDAVEVIPYDEQIARSHATLLAAVRNAGRPRGAHDLIIAATAHATSRTVVTADVNAFADLPGVTVRGPR